VLLLAVVIGEHGGQTPGNPEPKRPAEMAEAIARVIDTNTPKTRDVPIAFESATSHDNFVEVHYVTKDARFFPHDKAEGEKRRLGQAGHFCFDPRIPRIQLFAKKGVVIHQILAAPDDSAPFEFTVDESTCASLIAGAKTLAEMAEQERSTSPRSSMAPNSLTEPKRVRTTTIRTDRANEKWLESPGSSTAPNSLTEPKRVRTTTIRANRTEEKFIESPQSPMAPNSLTEP
jgi:CxxC motif-containing protein